MADPFKIVGRIIYLQEINEDATKGVIPELLKMDGDELQQPITLILDTYGGAVHSMFAFYDVIKSLNCPVHTLAVGKVMSAGVLLLAAGTRGQRRIAMNARLMIHHVSGTTGYNKLYEVQAQAEEMNRLQNMFIEALALETQLTPKEIEEMLLRPSDHYIDPSEAVRYGIVDKVLGPKSQL